MRKRIFRTGSIRKAEHWRIDAFEPWCWRRLLRVPWTARRSNQSILKEISPECSLEGLVLKLKLQYFGHLMQKNSLIWKDPDAGKDWRQEEKGTEDEMVGWHLQLNGREFGEIPGVRDGQGGPECCSPWVRKESDTTEWLNWTERRLAGERGAGCLFGGLDSKESSWQCRGLEFQPWVGKIPWRKEWLSTLIFLPGESLGQRSLAGYSHEIAESDTTEWLTLHFFKEG